MNCENYILLLDEYLNNELEEKIHGSVSAHLGVCESCRNEIRLLKLESNFYQKVGAQHERNFTDQWDSMRDRMIAESLINTDVLPKRNAAQIALRRSFFSSLNFWFNNLFAPKKSAVMALTLIVFGAVAIVLVLTTSNQIIDKPLTAATESTPIFTPTSADNLPHDEILPPQKSNEVDTVKRSPSHKNIYQKSLLETDKKYLAGDAKKTKNLKLPIKPLVKPNEASSTFIAVRSLDEANNLENKLASDDKKLANYLNKVHLFLLMFRNLENTAVINAVIGDKYQTEARSFLANNNNYKKASLKNNNIPAAELLNEIEPVLKAIANLDNQSGKAELNNVTAMVKQTGIVFKMRLWIANANFAEEDSL